jgi:subtilase family serine protease
MPSRLFSRFALPAFVLLSASVLPALAAVQNRISTPITSGNRVPMQHTIPGRALRANDLGSAPADRKLTTLSLRFSLTDAQQADLTQLLIDQQNPNSPSYHKWLTPEQYGARFGLSSADLAKVSSWLTGQGFTVTGVARSSTFITFSGTVAQVEQAFGTSIHTLSVDGEQHISNITDPVLPSSVASVVTGITGLNDFKVKPRVRVRSVQVDPLKPLYTQNTNGTVSHYIAPADFYTIYDVNSLISSGINGTGLKIAVVGQVDLVPTDISSFRTAAGLPASAPVLTRAGVDPGPPTSSGNGPTIGDLQESSLDVEWAGSAAPNASILFVYGVDVFANSLTLAVDSNLAPIISDSYGGCESGFGQSFLNTYNQLLQQANAQGITIVGPAGDSGATDCDDSGLATEGLNVDFPASSPFVTAAGGSMFNEGGSSTYWNTTNATNGGSATQYIPELPWNETTAASGLDAGGAGGGGSSAFFSKPAWQVGTGSGNTPADSSRDVPDISLNAASNHDGYLVCVQGSCTNGFLNSAGQANVFGGTSVAAPSFSGLLALIEQKIGATTSTTGGFGNINPTLYGLANSTYYNDAFHDITSGNNSVPCLQGTPNCPNGGSIGYSAASGYDLASGIGSINAANLAKDWQLATPAGGGSTIGNALSNTAVTASGALCAVSGSISLSVVVSGSISGTAPTGTVQFFVDGTATGSPVTLSSTGTATTTLTFPATLSGGHGISAVYSGDTNYAGSRGAVLASDGTLASVDIVSSSQKDFALTPCTASTTAAPGGSSTGITFTLTPANGFTGSINLIATPNNPINGTTSFSVTPVVITSTSGVTTSFVINAYVKSTTASLKAPRSIPSGKTPWYAAGSGATLACVLLFAFPRRRRWGALLAAVLSVAALTAVGCGGSSSSSSTGTGGGGTTTTTPATAGTYTFTVTGVSGSLVHSTNVTLTVP